MKTYYNSNLPSELQHSDLYFDTSALIAIISYEELFSELLSELKIVDCAFVTIPSVVFEFSRTDSIEGYNKRVSFIKTTMRIYPIERHLDQLRDLIPVLQHVAGKMSYSDFLLCSCLYKFHSYLITENYKDFPTNILDRTQVITIDNDKEIRHLGIYKMSEDKYQAAAKTILQKN